MTRTPIDGNHHVVSYVSGSKHQDGVVDGSAFIRRPADDDGLSVNWLEFFPSPRADQIREISHCSRITLRKSGRYAEMNVGNTTARVSAQIAGFAAQHDPLQAEGQFPEDPSHSLFIGLPPDSQAELAQAVGDIIAMTVTALHEPVVP